MDVKRFIVFLLVVLGFSYSTTYINSCGTLSTPGETYILTQDISIGSGTCFSINADGITLDGNGFTISGGDKGIDVTGNSVTIKNFNGINNFNLYGIYVFYSSNVLITNNYFSGNQYATYISHSPSGVTISNNNFSGNNVGVYLDSSLGVKIDGNDFPTNTYDGMILFSSNNSVISNNTISSVNEGIYAFYSSSNNLIIDNIIYHTIYGIHLAQSNSNTIKNNTLINNSNYGIFLDTSSSNTLSGNTAQDNFYGIYLNSGSDSNTINNNQLHNFNYDIYNLGNANSGSNNRGNHWYNWADDGKPYGFTYANEVPFVVNLLSPSNNSYLSTPVVDIIFKYSGSTNANCSLYLNGTLVSNNPNVYENTNTTFQTPYINWGNFSTYIYCYYSTLSNTSETVYFTVDSVPPYYSNITEYPLSPVSYSPTQTYQFNATWIDDFLGVDTVWIEHNFSGILQNYSVSSSGNMYYYDISSIPAGTYVYRWYSNDTLNNVNYTPYTTYTINKISPIITLSSSPSWNETYPTETNVSCTSSTPQVIINLYRNGTLVASGNNYVEDIENLSVGIYNYTCNTSGNENYTSASSSNTLTINKATPTLSLSSSPSWNETYPTETNVSCTSSTPQVIINLYRNGTLVASGNNYVEEVTTLSVGIYNYTCNTSGNENYTSFSVLKALELSLPVNNKKTTKELKINYYTECPDNDLTVTVKEDKNPIKNAKVILSIKQGSLYNSIYTEYTDFNGEAEFSLTHTGTYKIIVYYQDYPKKSETFDYTLCKTIMNETDETNQTVINETISNETVNETEINESVNEKEEKSEKEKENKVEENSNQKEDTKEKIGDKPLSYEGENDVSDTSPMNKGRIGEEQEKTLKRDESCYEVFGTCLTTFHWILITIGVFVAVYLILKYLFIIK